MKTLIVAAMALICASCANQPASEGKPLPGQTAQDMKLDIEQCKPPANLGDVMLTGGVVASIMREREYKRCMTNKGYTSIPAMPKDPGPKSGG